MGDENVSLPFGKRDKIYVFNIKSYLVTFHWTGLLTIKIMTLIAGLIRDYYCWGQPIG